MDLVVNKAKKKVIKKIAKKIKQEKYRFYPGDGNSKQAFLMLPKEFAQDLEDIQKTIMYQTRWIREDGIGVNPGWRIKVFGQMAEVVHKLVTAGVHSFKIKKATLEKGNFVAQNDFEVPFYNLIVKEIEPVV